MSQQLAAWAKNLQRSTLAMILITILLLLLRNSFLHTVDAFDFVGKPLDDSQFNNGSSSSELISRAQPLVFECNLSKEKYEWPYCEYEFQLGEGEHGLDLSQMETIHVRASLSLDGEPLQDKSMRVYLKNRDLELYDELGFKTNYVEYSPSAYPQGITIPYSYLQVPDWWRNELNIDVHKANVDTRNVTLMSLASPAYVEPGLYRFEIYEFKVSGKWGSDQAFYLLIILSWLVFAGILVARGFVYSYQRAKALKKENEDLIKSNREAIVKASYDSLTGALNRSGSGEITSRLLDDSNSIAVIFLDIDKFKELNDNFGHQCGDKILQEFGRLVLDICDPGQHLVRWGGEEFLLLCENISQDEAHLLAQHIQSLMGNKQWPYEQQVSCSIGISIWTAELSFKQVLDKADKAMYAAKQQGRNRIVLSNDENKH